MDPVDPDPDSDPDPQHCLPVHKVCSLRIKFSVHNFDVLHTILKGAMKILYLFLKKKLHL